MPTMVHGFSDGGFIDKSKMAAGWWLFVNGVVVHAKGELITWKSPSNNVAEYFGLIKLLEAALDRGHVRLAVNMDSLLVVQQVLGHWECKNQVLLELLQYVRALVDQFTFFSINHTLREGNTVADALCNKAFDGFDGTNRQWYNTVDRATAQLEVKAVAGKEDEDYALSSYMEVHSIVMNELKSIGPMLRNHMVADLPEFKKWVGSEPNLASASSSIRPLSVDKTPAPLSGDDAFVGSGPNLASASSSVLPLASDGSEPWPYVILPEALVEMKSLAKEGNVQWDEDRFKTLVPVVNQHGISVVPYPKLDAQFTTSILKGINWNLPRLIKAWRGQSVSDPRPNKSLDFSRIERNTSGYDQQSALKDIINEGYSMHWKKPFKGVRPLPKNLVSAEDNSEIMGAMILKQYKQGRLMVMNAQEVADNVPEFASSAYGCVAKANKPLTHACRPIHNQSAPLGRSINEGLDADLRPDATWPGASHIADRILTASHLYGASNLKAFITDITDAFLQVGLTANDVQVNGGILPKSNIATLATSCIFGNCESPAAFRILNCVPHIHRQASSVVNGINTAFDVRFYVDDGNAIEPDIEDRLFLAEASLRKSILDVFGKNSIQEEKTSTWTTNFTSLGYAWDLPSGTVTIPAEKLLRVKTELLRFSTLTTATVTEFRSLVGKLRHVSTCCKPAGALMQMLGGGLSAHKVKGGRQNKKITNLMRSELRWWAAFLTAERFHNLPVEWLGKRENKVTNWIHCYSEKNVGVWLVSQTERSLRFTPWNSSLLMTLLTGIANSLTAHTPAARMSHTRILLNDCGVANTLNRGSSPDFPVQNLLKTIGVWQLDHRHRLSATTTLWEKSPLLSISPCCYHPNTNPLFQISHPPNMDKNWPLLLSLGRLKPSRTAPGRRISDLLSTGSCSVRQSTSHLFGSMNSAQETKQLSWRGLRSSVEPKETTRKGKGISTLPMSTRKQPSSGHTSTTETLSCSSMAQRWCWWKLPISGTKTARNQRSHVLPVCCSVVTTSSVLPRLRGAHSRGGSSSSNISFSDEEGSFGKPITLETGWIKPNAITESSGTMSSCKIMKERRCISLNQEKCIKFKLPSTMRKPTKPVEVTSSLLVPQDTPSFAQYVEQSSPSRTEVFGNRKESPTPYQVVLSPRISRQSSSAPPRLKVSTRMMSLDTPSVSAMPLPCSKLGMMNWSSDWQEDGRARPWPATPASQVKSC